MLRRLTDQAKLPSSDAAGRSDGRSASPVTGRTELRPRPGYYQPTLPEPNVGASISTPGIVLQIRKVFDDREDMPADVRRFRRAPPRSNFRRSTAADRIVVPHI